MDSRMNYRNATLIALCQISLGNNIIQLNCMGVSYIMWSLKSMGQLYHDYIIEKTYTFETAALLFFQLLVRCDELLFFLWILISLLENKYKLKEYCSTNLTQEFCTNKDDNMCMAKFIKRKKIDSERKRMFLLNFIFMYKIHI